MRTPLKFIVTTGLAAGLVIGLVSPAGSTPDGVTQSVRSVAAPAPLAVNLAAPAPLPVLAAAPNPPSNAVTPLPTCALAPTGTTKTKGTDLSVWSSPMRSITTDDTHDRDITLYASATYNGKAAKGAVTFYIGSKKVGKETLKKGEASLDTKVGARWGKFNIKAVYVPTTKGAKKTTTKHAAYFQHQAEASYSIGSESVSTSGTVAIKPKAKVKLKGLFTTTKGKKLTGTVEIAVMKKTSDGSYSTIKTTTVKVKRGKAAYTWKNTLPKGTEGRFEVTLDGGKHLWGLTDSVDFVSGALDDQDSSSGSGSTAPAPYVPPKTCSYVCVRYGYGAYGLPNVYGCVQTLYQCT